MATTLELTATVLPGGRIEFSAPGLPEGREVEISVRVPSDGEGSRRRSALDVIEDVSEEVTPPAARTGHSILDVLREVSGPRLFHTAEEVDAYIREERDAWER
jgi:hypothetical protein